MARTAATADAFHAVAEPRRRRILELLQDGERSVNDLAETLHVRQPAASKHLKVLREADLVRVRGAGRHRLYRLNAPALEPIHDWVSTFERIWSERFDRLDEYLRELQEKEKENDDACDS